MISDRAKKETDYAVINAKALYENNIVDQSSDREP